jgi:hypothetical protein
VTPPPPPPATATATAPSSLMLLMLLTLMLLGMISHAAATCDVIDAVCAGSAGHLHSRH